MTLRGIVFSVAAFTLPLGSFAAPKVFLIGFAPLLIIILLWLGHRDGRAVPNFPWGAAWLAFAILIWAGASYWWSLDPGHSLKKLVDLSLVAIGTLALFGIERQLLPRERFFLGASLTLGLVLFFAMLLSDISTDGALSRLLHDGSGKSVDGLMSKLNRGVSIVALLTWTAIIFLYSVGRMGLGLVLGLAAVAICWASTATSAAVSVSLGLLTFLAFLKLPSRAVSWVAGFAALWVFVAPFILGGVTKIIDPTQHIQNPAYYSVVHRLIIWQFSAERIVERPLLGVGLRASRNIPGAKTKVIIGEKNGQVRTVDVFSLHPHNGIIEWWLELGLPGAALGAIVVFCLFQWPKRIRDPVVRALLIGQLITAFGIFNLSFGAWQTWWLIGLVLAAFMAAVVLEGEQDRPRLS